MKTQQYRLGRWGASVLVLFCFFNAFAQKDKGVIQNSWAAAHQTDGELNEWSEAIWQFHKNSQISYALANNDSTLFIAIKTADKTQLRQLFADGIRLYFNAMGKKKAQQGLHFLQMRGMGRMNGTPQTQQKDAFQALRAAVANIREIRVSGFDQILDGPIALQNDYGIRAAAALNAQGELSLEYSLPMKLLQIDASKSDIFATQISLNGLNPDPTRNPANWNRMNGYAMGRSAPGNLIYSDKETVSIWILSRLAKRGQ